MSTLTKLHTWHDDALVGRLHKLVRGDCRLTAQMLRLLAEVDRRKLYVERGYSSLFAYCLEVLKMPDTCIGPRIHAARCCRRFPRLFDMLDNGQVHLSAILMLAPRLRPENFEELAGMACHQSKRKLQHLLADLEPKADVPCKMQKLPTARQVVGSAAQADLGIGSAVPCTSTSAQPNEPCAQQGAQSAAVDNGSAPQPQTPTAAPRPATTVCAPSPSPPARPTVVEPLGASRYKLQLTASQQLKDKLDQAGNLLRHRFGRADLPGLIEYALDRLIAEENKRQHGATDKPRDKRPSANETPPSAEAQGEAAALKPSREQAPCVPRAPSRHIPNAVRREVYARDQGQCTFVSQDGHRCSERGGLQYHHELPFGKGGPSTAQNVRLLCFAHNALLARRDYGEGAIEACITRSRQRRERAVAGASEPARRLEATGCSRGLGAEGAPPQRQAHRVALLPFG